MKARIPLPLALALLILCALPAAASGAVYELEGPVEGDANSTVSMEVLVRNGTARALRNLAYENLDAYCPQDAEGPDTFVGEISGNAGTNQDPPGIDGRSVHWISYPENPSRQVTMSGSVSKRAAAVRAEIGVFNNDFCGNATGAVTATRQDGGPPNEAPPAGSRLAREIAQLESEARRLSNTFAGIWVDRGGRQLDINIAFTSRPASKVSTLARDFPKPRLLDPVKVQRSLRALNDEQAELIADRESFRGRPSPFPGIFGGEWDLDIDLPSNALVVVVDEPSAETVEAIRSRYGSDVIVRGGGPLQPDVLYPCATRFLCYSLRSGLETAVTAADVGSAAKPGCSTAFASHFGRTTKTGILSAAHCGEPDADLGSARFHAENHAAQYGVVEQEAQYGRSDAEWHYVSKAREPFTVSPTIYVDDSERSGKVRDIGKWEELVIGYSYVCKSGIMTDKSCGTVLSKEYSPSWVSWADDFVTTTVCGAPGDSGAGIYSKIPALKQPSGPSNSYQAVGIYSGSNSKKVACGDPKYFSVFGHIEFAQKALNVRVLRAAK